MYKRFTESARNVMQLAVKEAQRLDHEYIGTEHILLGLAKESSGAAVNVLKYLGVAPQTIITEIERVIQRGLPVDLMDIPPRTPRAKKVIEYSMEEANTLKHDYVGTEHILLGLLREDEGVAAQVLMNLGLRLEKVRAEIRAILQQSSENEKSNEHSPQSRIRWGDDETKCHGYPLDDETKNRARQFAEEITSLDQAKMDAVARMDFDKAAQLRDKADEKRREFAALDLPAWVRKNVERFSDALRTKVSRFPLLDMLHDEAGEPDAGVLSVLPNPLMPPVKIVVGTLPRFPVSTLKALMVPDDIGSPYFQALVPLISPESVAHRKGNHTDMTRFAFFEIGRAENPTWGRPVLLCIVRPTLLPQDVRDEVYAGLHRTNCDFVVFEAGAEAHSLLGNLPPGTKLMGV